MHCWGRLQAVHVTRGWKLAGSRMEVADPREEAPLYIQPSAPLGGETRPCDQCRRWT
jgi:hypothetical protein